MSYIVNKTVRGRDNRAPGSPAGRENVQSGVIAPLDVHEALYLGSPVSVTSITRSGNVATLTATTHGMAIGNIIKIAGAEQPQYNGEKLVRSVATANTLTFDVYGDPDSASGTVTVQKVF